MLNWLFPPQVSDVKKNIETVQGSDVYPASQQMLIHQGKVLKDVTTLEENKVAENSFVVVMLTKVSSAAPFVHFLSIDFRDKWKERCNNVIYNVRSCISFSNYQKKKKQRLSLSLIFFSTYWRGNNCAFSIRKIKGEGKK